MGASREAQEKGGERLSVIVPLYNEGVVIAEFHRRLDTVLQRLDCDYEIVLVNDGSDDGSTAMLEALRESDPRVSVVELSRNYGKEIATTAGLDYAEGDAVLLIDADLQDPPELIPELLAKWREGYDVVYAVRTVRRGEGPLKRLTAFLFYRLMGRMGEVRIPADTGDFRLLSRRAVEAVRRCRERHRFMKGIFTWIGYRQVGVPYEREARRAGASKWDYWRLWNFALEGITSFSTLPLRVSTYLGFLVATLAFLFGLFIVAKTLLYGDPVAGYPSLMTVVLFLGGLQLMAIGVLGEYVGRMFDETKGRPLYFVERHLPTREDERK